MPSNNNSISISISSSSNNNNNNNNNNNDNNNAASEKLLRRAAGSSGPECRPPALPRRDGTMIMPCLIVCSFVFIRPGLAYNRLGLALRAVALTLG